MSLQGRRVLLHSEELDQQVMAMLREKYTGSDRNMKYCMKSVAHLGRGRAPGWEKPLLLLR